MYVLVKARRAVEVVTPDGAAARLAALREGARLFVGEVATGMAEREAELRHRQAHQQALPAPTATERPALHPREGRTDGHS
jgi:hypothetical protein